MSFRVASLGILLVLVGSSFTILLNASWSYTNSTIPACGSGYVDIEFVEAFSDDDGQMDHPEYDAHDDGTDPGYGKNVASCKATIDVDGQVRVEVNNGYPGYRCQFWTTVQNVGCRQLCLKDTELNIDPALEVAVVNIPRNRVLNPGERWTEAYFVRIKQQALGGAYYRFEIAVDSRRCEC